MSDNVYRDAMERTMAQQQSEMRQAHLLRTAITSMNTQLKRRGLAILPDTASFEMIQEAGLRYAVATQEAFWRLFRINADQAFAVMTKPVDAERVSNAREILLDEDLTNVPPRIVTALVMDAMQVKELEDLPGFEADLNNPQSVVIYSAIDKHIGFLLKAFNE